MPLDFEGELGSEKSKKHKGLTYYTLAQLTTNATALQQ
ncbi:MAG: hypothetical protein ACJAXB_002731 [Candidatus Endobugula sp.]|jgi:hypothetical protein